MKNESAIIKLSGVSRSAHNAMKTSEKKLYTLDPVTQTYYVDEKTWLNLRKDVMTASVVGDILDGAITEGRNKQWASSLEIYFDKIGVIPKMNKATDEDLFGIGHAAEALICEMYIQKLKKDGWDVQLSLGNEFATRDGFAGATPDAVGTLDGKPFGAELKSIQFNSPNYRLVNELGTVPFTHWAQIQWTMYVKDCDLWGYCAAWGLNTSSCFATIVKRSDEFISLMVDAAKGFMECVKTKTPPDTASDDIYNLNNIYRRMMGPYSAIAEDKRMDVRMSDAVMRYIELDKDVEEAEKIKKAADDAVKEAKRIRDEILVREVLPTFGDHNRGIGTTSTGQRVLIDLRTKPAKRGVNLDSFDPSEPEDKAILEKYMVEKTEKVFDSKAYFKNESYEDILPHLSGYGELTKAKAEKAKAVILEDK